MDLCVPLPLCIRVNRCDMKSQITSQVHLLPWNIYGSCLGHGFCSDAASSLRLSTASPSSSAMLRF